MLKIEKSFPNEVRDKSFYRLFDEITSIMSAYTPKDLTQVKSLELIHNPDFLAFLDANVAISIILDFQTQGYFYISDNIREIWGHSREDFYNYGLQKTMSIFPLYQNEIIIHKIFPLMFDYFNKHALTGEACDLRVSYPTKVIRGDGTEGWYLHQIKVLYTDDQNKPILGLKVITDINDFKKDDIITMKIAKKDHNGIFKNIFSQSFSQENNSYTVSEREKEVLLLLDEGKSSLEIGDQLFISSHTVNTHRRNLLRKFDAKSTVDMLKKALAYGII
ncbi:MAG: hypothetical protein JWO58_1480 [Chitinophagaceae bacterium]|nr:hypothetical protein [Chitinophagaceae bacterium]